jgi:hypothetical protein
MEEPHPLNERQSHEAELAQLRDRIAVYRGELTGEPAPDEMRQEWLDWQIRRAKNRIALVESWLRAEPS